MDKNQRHCIPDRQTSQQQCWKDEHENLPLVRTYIETPKICWKWERCTRGFTHDFDIFAYKLCFLLVCSHTTEKHEPCLTKCRKIVYIKWMYVLNVHTPDDNDDDAFKRYYMQYYISKDRFKKLVLLKFWILDNFRNAALLYQHAFMLTNYVYIPILAFHHWFN